MKVALAQMKVVPGMPKRNVENMLSMISDAKRDGVRLIVFPEMCVGGYLLGDKWLDDEYCEYLMSFNEVLRKASEGIAIAYGNIFVDREINLRNEDNEIHPNKDGRSRKYNAVYVFENGKPAKRKIENKILPEGIQPKLLLPNYRIFDDERYFFSLKDVARDFDVPLKDIVQPFVLHVGEEEKYVGVELCEDLWCEEYRENLNALNITKVLIENGAEIICNLSASPWTFGKNKARDKRVLFLKKESGESFVPFFYVNCTGVQNNGKNIITFDGGSTIYDGNGQPILFAKEAYKQELIVFETDEKFGNLVRNENTKIAQKYLAIIEGLKYLKDITGAVADPKIVIGLSGGIDSALVASLCVIAFGKQNVLGVNMPTKYNSDKTKGAAKFVADKLGIKYSIVPIQSMAELNENVLDNADLDGTGKKLSVLNIENVQAKIRGTSLLSNLASKYGAIFTNNGNKLETALGYATLYGDVGGAIAPIADLTKIEVVELAKFLNNEVFHKEVIPNVLLPDKLWRFGEEQIQPSAELKEKQIDPMKFVYHCALLDAVTDYQKKSPSVVMQWFVDGILHKKLDEYLFPITGENVGLDLMKRWGVTNSEEFLKDLEWFFPLVQKNVFKRVQAPPIVITSKSSYGYDIRESMLPYEKTAKEEELKKFILENIKEYQPHD